MKSLRIIWTLFNLITAALLAACGNSETVANGVTTGANGASITQQPVSPYNSVTTNPSVSLSAGALDSSFGSGGVVVTSVNGKQAVARALGIQQDGKIVVAGGSYTVGNQTYSDEEFIVMRYNLDGSSDSSFGLAGKVTLSINSGAQATALAVQPDGKIVIAGFVGSGSNIYDFLVVRLNSDGSLDQGFGSEGKIITSIIPHPVTDSMPLGYRGSRASRLVLQPDGKIVVGGNTYEGWIGSPGPDGSLPSGYALARYNADGSLDNGFGLNGIVLSKPDRFSTLGAVVIQADGKLVVGGGSTGGGRYFSFLVRFNTDGTPDVTFKYTDFGTGLESRVISSIAVQGDGRIVAIISGDILTRYNSDGSIDTNFGNGGNVSALNWYRSRNAVSIQSDGKIVVAGSTVNSAFFDWSNDRPTELALERYTNNGAPDDSFGSGGATMGLYSHDTNASAISLQQDGKIVIAGASKNNQFKDAFTVVRCIP